MRNVTAAVLCVFPVLASCAVHPLPDDVTRDTTPGIVHKIQCEAREALNHLSEEIFLQSGDQATREMATAIEADRLKVTDIFANGSKYHPVLLKDDLALLKAYTLSAVTFDFNFTISETNDNSAGGDFRLPVVGGLFTLGASSEAKLQRQNVRKFQITNSFFELHDIDPANCAIVTARSGNVVYPIEGRIGIEEVFRSFIVLDSGAGSTGKPGSASLFTDTLTFTTTLTASLGPKITLNPSLKEVFKVADASGTLSATRVDAHQVAIAIARGSPFVSVEEARKGAKIVSRAIADQNRVDFFFNGYRAPLSLGSPLP